MAEESKAGAGPPEPAEALEMAPGLGLITRIGWERIDDGTEEFRASVWFPGGAPRLSVGVVWDQIPVVIVTESVHEELVEHARAGRRAMLVLANRYEELGIANDGARDWRRAADKIEKFLDVSAGSSRDTNKEQASAK